MTTKQARESDLIDWAWQLIIPDEAEKRLLCSGGQVLVHYTKPETAKDILKKPELWLSNARTMKDQEEVTLGRKCVDQFLNEKSDELARALNAIAPNLWAEVLECWQRESSPQIDQTYIACFTSAAVGGFVGSKKHWRAYGQVAFHFDPAFARDEPASLSLYLVKVTYGRENAQRGLTELLANFKKHRESLARLPCATLVSFIRHRLFFISIATKGHGFAWDREWRLAYTPYLFSSAHLHEVSAKPVHALPLRNTSDKNNSLLSLPNLIRHLVVQSSGRPEDRQLRLDLIGQLSYHGVTDATKRVLLVT